ncbi:MAG: DMT family transporter [Chloroflexi bacterium]|nr:MAG: DMT family transporter [Chloroflexota bacterium]
MLVGLAGGLAVGIQAPLANLMSQRLGTWESIFILHFGGAVAGLIPLLLMGGGNLSAWRTVPWYALAAGVFGLVVIGSISYTMPRIGVAATILLVVAGQLLVGLVLDHYGLLGNTVRPMDVWRLVGIAVVLGGVWLIVR